MAAVQPAGDGDDPATRTTAVWAAFAHAWNALVGPGALSPRHSPVLPQPDIQFALC